MLDKKLKDIGNRNQPFVGISIIFAGDFRQLEPVGSNDKELLFSSKSSGHWDNCINAIFILDNNHCFKDDPLYGQMLKRMWNGELSIAIGDSRLCCLHFDTCSLFQPCVFRGWHTPFHLEAHRLLMLSRHLVVWPFIRELSTK